MIERIHIKNFRSIRDLEWEPGKLNVLVGANNAGKTNICLALRFLGELARHESITAAAAAACGSPGELGAAGAPLGGPDLAVLWQGCGDGWPGSRRASYEATCYARDGVAGTSAPLMRVLEGAHAVEPTGESLPLLRVFDEERGEVTWALDESGSRMMDDVGAGWGAAIGRPLDASRYPTLCALQRDFRAIRYYSPELSAMRASGAVRPDTDLAGDGRNLASMLYTLKNEDEASYRALLDAVGEIEPRLRYLNFIRLADSTVVAEVVMEGSSEPMTLHAMSDGTLRYLAMCLIALLPNVHSRREFQRPSLLMIEEPENGLYCRHLGKLVDRLVEASGHTQVIVTTHNPMFLDYFDDKLDCLWVVERDEQQGTTIRRPNFGLVEEMLEHMSLGEMLFQEVLGCE